MSHNLIYFFLKKEAQFLDKTRRNPEGTTTYKLGKREKRDRVMMVYICHAHHHFNNNVKERER